MAPQPAVRVSLARIREVEEEEEKESGNDYGIGRMRNGERVERARSLPHGSQDIKAAMLAVDKHQHHVASSHQLNGAPDYSAEAGSGSERTTETKASSTALLISESGVSSTAPSLRLGSPGAPATTSAGGWAALVAQLAAMGFVGWVAALVSALSLYLLLNVPRHGPDLLWILQLAILAFTFGASFAAVAVTALQVFLALRALAPAGGDAQARIAGFLAQGVYLRSVAYLGLAVSFPLLLFALIIWAHLVQGSGLTAYLVSGVLGAPLLLLLAAMGHAVYAWGWGHLRVPYEDEGRDKTQQTSGSSAASSPSMEERLARKLSTLV